MYQYYLSKREINEGYIKVEIREKIEKKYANFLRGYKRTDDPYKIVDKIFDIEYEKELTIRNVSCKTEINKVHLDTDIGHLVKQLIEIDPNFIKWID